MEFIQSVSNNFNLFDVSQFNIWLRLFLVTLNIIGTALFSEFYFRKIKTRAPLLQSRFHANYHVAQRHSFLGSVRHVVLSGLICAIVYFANTAISLLLCYFVYNFAPQKEAFLVLFKRIFFTQTESFIFPFFASIAVGSVFGVVRNKVRDSQKIIDEILDLRFSRKLRKKLERPKNAILSLTAGFLLVSIMGSSGLFVLDTFRQVQRPHYTPPTETIASMLNARLGGYSLCMSGSDYAAIGDGEFLRIDISAKTPVPNESTVATPQASPTYKEPSDFRGYIDALLDSTCDEGMWGFYYLTKAFKLFKAGKHNNDYLYIGIMWSLMATTGYHMQQGLSDIECLENAKTAYLKYENINGESFEGCNNIAIIYNALGDIKNARSYYQKSLAYQSSKNKAFGNYYVMVQEQIRIDAGVEDSLVFMNDALYLLNTKKDLSLYVLYATHAIAFNQKIDEAYEYLKSADEYYKQKSAFVKILMVICQSLLGVDEQETLAQVYSLEEQDGLTSMEQWYLMKYLFANGHNEELFGYFNDTSAQIPSVRKSDGMAMEAAWYLNQPFDSQKNLDGKAFLLEEIEAYISTTSVASEEKDLLAVVSMLLLNSLGEAVEDNKTSVQFAASENTVSSELELVMLGTNAFNNAQYELAIVFSEKYMLLRQERQHQDAGRAAAKESSETKETEKKVVILKLNPQEDIVLYYYMQLIKAHSHFEYAQLFQKKTKNWSYHMQQAERECNVFENSTKSLTFIEDKFKILKSSIDVVNGKLPGTEDGAPVTIFDFGEKAAV